MAPLAASSGLDVDNYLPAMIPHSAAEHDCLRADHLASGWVSELYVEVF